MGTALTCHTPAVDGLQPTRNNLIILLLRPAMLGRRRLIARRSVLVIGALFVLGRVARVALIFLLVVVRRPAPPTSAIGTVVAPAAASGVTATRLLQPFRRGGVRQQVELTARTAMTSSVCTMRRGDGGGDHVHREAAAATKIADTTTESDVRHREHHTTPHRAT